MRKKVVATEPQNTEPYVTLKRTGFLTWNITVTHPDLKNDWYYGNTDYYTAHGTPAHARAKAERKLRKAKREYDWRHNVVRLDVKK